MPSITPNQLIRVFRHVDQNFGRIGLGKGDNQITQQNINAALQQAQKYGARELNSYIGSDDQQAYSYALGLLSYALNNRDINTEQNSLPWDNEQNVLSELELSVALEGGLIPGISNLVIEAPIYTPVETNSP